MDALNATLHDFLQALLAFADPGLSYLLAGYAAVLACIGTHPIRITDEQRLTDLSLIKLRQLIFLSLAAGVCMATFLIFPIAGRLYGSDAYSVAFVEAATRAITQNWATIPFFLVTSWLLTFCWHRQLAPYLSNLQRRLRVRQSGDALSDVRVEQAALNPKQYDPGSYYREGHVFFGLDQAGQPIYETEADFKSRNLKVIGPTQTGKGVLQGVLIDQAIRHGWTVIFVNPKPDRFIPGIMRQACTAAGREPPLELDLTGQGTGKYAPFASGSPRQRRARLLWAFGLNDDGGQADFYKVAERSLLDKLLPRWDGGLESLWRLLHPKKSDTGGIDEAAEVWRKSERLRGYIAEWLAHKPLTAEAGQGFDIARTIKGNRVAHVRGSVSDPLVIKATTVLLMDLIQTIEQLGDDPKPHILIVVDEVKFMLSEVLARGLATILDKGANIVIAYQTVKDLLTLEDKRLNAEAIKSAVENNCKYTFCYQAQDADTAEWAAAMSGTIQKTVPRMEKVESNRLGAELWSRERTLATVEEQYLSPNRMLMLPARVAAFFRPGRLAELAFTSWVSVTTAPVPAAPARRGRRVEPIITEAPPPAPVAPERIKETPTPGEEEEGGRAAPLHVPTANASPSSAAGKQSARPAAKRSAPPAPVADPAPSQDELAKLSEDLSKLK